MSKGPIVQLPQMPMPANYGYDPKSNEAVNLRAERAYKDALKVWERVMTAFATTHKLDQVEPQG